MESSMSKQIFSYVLGTGAVVIAARRALALFITVSALPPDSSVTVDKSSVSRPPLTRSQKILAGLKGIAIIWALGAAFGGIFFVFAKYASQSVNDMFFGTAIFAFMSIMIRASVDIISPPPIRVSFAKKGNRRFIKCEELWQETAGVLYNTHLRSLLSIITTSAIFTSAFYNLDAPAAIAMAAVILPILTHFRPNTLQVRWIVRIYFLFIGAIIAVFGVCYIVFEVFKVGSGSNDNEDDSSDLTSPSVWIVMLANVWNQSQSIYLTGIIVVTMLRFDYSRANIQPLDDSDMVTKSEINTRRLSFDLPAFSKPHFNVAIISLGLTLSAMYLLQFESHVGRVFQILAESNVTSLFTTPAVLLGVAGFAWFNGTLREFWEYEERWIPKADEVPSADEVERGDGEKGVAAEKAEVEQLL